MDALALLCTLHADGPKTARRLRLAGAHNLGALHRMPLGELAEALDRELPDAERFLREADVLGARTGDAALEEEAPDDPARLEPAPAPARPRVEPADLMQVDEASTATTPEPTEHVLQRYVINPLIRPIKGGLRVRRISSSSGSRLRAGLLSGLDREACERLAISGVRTAEDLSKASGLDLALELGWAYDRVFHLKKEASHYVRTQRAQDAPRATQLS